jgi:thioredoxin reductase (NADPH)
LIVGGRNSAAEAAIRCYRAGAEVTMCHRGEDLDYDVIKYWLTPELQGLIRQGRINFLPNVMPISIEPGKVKLTRLHERMVTGEPPFDHPVDFVLLLTGYVADMTLFNMAGVTLIGEEQKPTFDPATMETDVPGLFVAGTAAAGTQSQFKVFIETAHADVEKITRVITGVSVPWSVRAPRSTMPEQ